jgi:hypothetical protein
MKKRSLSSLKLNKQSIAAFADQLNGGNASFSGLNMSCPNICVVTKEGIVCEEIKFPPLDAAQAPHSPYNPAPSDAAANASVDSPAG